jgi:hypothetical protein
VVRLVSVGVRPSCGSVDRFSKWLHKVRSCLPKSVRIELPNSQ